MKRQAETSLDMILAVGLVIGFAMIFVMIMLCSFAAGWLIGNVVWVVVAMAWEFWPR